MFLFNKTWRGDCLSNWIQWCQRLWAVVDARERRCWMIWWLRCARFGVWSIGHLQNRSASACQHFISKLFRRSQICPDSFCKMMVLNYRLIVYSIVTDHQPKPQIDHQLRYISVSSRLKKPFPIPTGLQAELLQSAPEPATTLLVCARVPEWKDSGPEKTALQLQERQQLQLTTAVAVTTQSQQLHNV